MNIGQAATASGVSAKMVRHFESLGLLPRIARTQAGYRQYGDNEAHAADLERRITEMPAMKRTLEHRVHCCRGDERPECPILDELSDG